MRRHGQRHPVLGRRLAPPMRADIELIYGSRRLIAAAHLGIALLVDVRELDDRDAIVEMEIENRLRADISAYERGMSYRRWLSAGIFGSQSELAKELGVSQAQVCRLLRYAELPAAVVGAFDTVQSIKEEWAVALAKICQDPNRRPGILRRAREVSRYEPRYPSQVVFRRLVSAARLPGRDIAQPRDEVVKNLSGKPMYRIAIRAKALHFIVPRDGLSEPLVHELKRRISSTLEPVAQRKEPSDTSYASGPARSSARPPVNASV